MRQSSLLIALLSAVAVTGCDPVRTDQDGGTGAGPADAGTSGGSDGGGASTDAGRPSLVFSSHWTGSALGATDDAVRDTTSATPWGEATNLDALSVIANSTAIDFPPSMTHLLQVSYPGGASAEVRCFDCWTAPAIGESIWYRWYFRFDFPDSYGDLDTQPHHPFAARFGQCPFDWEFKFGPRMDGTLDTLIPFYSSNIELRPPQPLSKFKTYRLELGFHRQAATTFKVDLRLYDSAGALVFDDATLRVIQDPDGGTLASLDPDITITEDTCLQSLQLGSNGPGGTYDVLDGGAVLDIGGVAVSRDGWIGPFVEGEHAGP